ncbi:Kinesin-like protein Kif23 Arf6-interacting domain [Trinorchestia longiramus]|nr:Kinesin-like protein Kif23 Arf6-interacting domain [Trinorchestia longiramus]
MKAMRTPIRPRVPPKPAAVEQHQAAELNNNMKNSGGQDPVDVFCRIRPVDSLDTCVSIVDTTTLRISPPSSVGRSGCGREHQYRFKEVFGPQSTQKEIFNKVAKPLVGDLLNGKNGLLFAYGVTGSGKTHTMQGSSKDGGIVRRTLDVIFNSIGEWQSKRCILKPDHLNGFEIQTDADASTDRKQHAANQRGFAKFRTPRPKRDTSGSTNSSSDRVPDTTAIEGLNEDNVYGVFITYLEAYNNYIYDLLENVSDINMTKSLQTKILREDGQHNMYVFGCNEVEVKSPEEALDLLSKGQKRRKVAHTSLNAESSRSHSIFTIRVVQCPLDEQGEDVLTTAPLRISQLSLVDLAGSERTSRTGAAGLRVKEAGNINNTLMMLRTCIEVLRDNQLNSASRMVPYRDSKITHYFKNYFDGEGKVKMVICVNPLSSDYDETLPVMKFAELASEVQVQRSVVRNENFALPPGRRRANFLFREVRRNMINEGYDKAKELDVDITPVYTLSPAWPDTELSDDSWLDTLAKLKSFLKRRIGAREALLQQTQQKVTTVTEQVATVEAENIVLRQSNSSLNALRAAEERKLREYEGLLLNAEAVNESLYNNYNNLVEDYNQAVEERALAQNQGQLEKMRIKAKLSSKLEMHKDKIDKEFKNKLKEHKNKMVLTQVRALQQLAGSSSSSSSTGSAANTPTDRPITRQSARTVAHPSSAAASNLAGLAVSHPRHRRSLSQGNVNVVLDHRPLKTLDTNTVYKPVMGKRRSVTKLRSTDLSRDRVTHYCLTTQNQDSQGELETKLYKGDVLPTTGGGAQVVFQDVEILRQRDPLAVPSSGVKRGSDGTPATGSVDAALQHERWKALTSNAPPTPRGVSNKKTRLN